MVIELFLSSTLASGSLGDPPWIRWEGILVDGGVPPEEELDVADIRRCCCRAAARAAPVESSMITCVLGCGMICTPVASGGGQGRGPFPDDLDLSELMGEMVMDELRVMGTLGVTCIC
uniref:Putative secreted protein n=1 Tax=Ixodes ricinus TaxID=34613 RepID=A0A6B0UM32_IXORI